MTEEEIKYYEKALSRYPEINPDYQSLIISKLEKELEEHENKIKRIKALVEQYER